MKKALLFFKWVIWFCSLISSGIIVLTSFLWFMNFVNDFVRNNQLEKEEFIYGDEPTDF